MKQLDELRVVLVGCGSMASAWVDATLALAEQNVKLVGLVDVRREAALAKAEKHKLPQNLVYNTLSEAVKATGANVVFDVTIPAAHDQVTIEALSLGCHVLGEKPMSDTLEKAQRMVAAAKKADRLYGITQTRRPDGRVLAIVDFLATGALGPVEEVHSDFYIGAHFGGFRDEMDQVLLLDMAIHTFDNARQMGRCDPVSVYCQSWNPPHSWYKGHASACAIFEMKDAVGNPIVYTYRGSWCNEGLMTDWNADWRIVGSQGTLRWNGADVIQCETIKADGSKGFFHEMQNVEVPRPHRAHSGHAAMIRNFTAALQKGEPLICPCEDNIKSLAMVLAAVESANTGQKIAVRW